jgi:hypothetical protein
LGFDISGDLDIKIEEDEEEAEVDDVGAETSSWRRWSPLTPPAESG